MDSFVRPEGNTPCVLGSNTEFSSFTAPQGVFKNVKYFRLGHYHGSLLAAVICTLFLQLKVVFFLTISPPLHFTDVFTPTLETMHLNLI